MYNVPVSPSSLPPAPLPHEPSFPPPSPHRPTPPCAQPPPHPPHHDPPRPPPPPTPPPLPPFYTCSAQGRLEPSMKDPATPEKDPGNFHLQGAFLAVADAPFRPDLHRLEK